MKTIEKVYIGFTFLPIIGLLIFILGINPYGHDGAQLFLVIFSIVSLIITVIGIVLILMARGRKAELWPLILATLMASSYWFFILGRFILKVF